VLQHLTVLKDDGRRDNTALSRDNSLITRTIHGSTDERCHDGSALCGSTSDLDHNGFVERAALVILCGQHSTHIQALCKQPFLTIISESEHFHAQLRVRNVRAL